MCVNKLWFKIYFLIILTGFHKVMLMSGVFRVTLQSPPHSSHTGGDLSVSGFHNSSRALGIPG